MELNAALGAGRSREVVCRSHDGPELPKAIKHANVRVQKAEELQV
jgi:hypothetical protein